MHDIPQPRKRGDAPHATIGTQPKQAPRRHRDIPFSKGR